MPVVIGILALLVAATVAAFAWVFGFGKGYELGVQHGRETAEAVSPTTHVHTFRREPTGAEAHRALLAQMDRTRLTTVRLDGSRGGHS